MADAATAAAGPNEPEDVAVWADPLDASRSLILVAHKGRGGGIAIHEPSGALAGFVGDHGGMQGIDLREGFSLGDSTVPLVVATRHQHGHEGVAFFRIDPGSRTLVALTSSALALADPRKSGVCLYRSASSGDLHLFLTGSDAEGRIEQWTLPASADGHVSGRLARRWWVGGELGGCVADDQRGLLFVAEKDRGIWSYGAEPGDGLDRSLVDDVDGGRLQPDVEGLALLRDQGVLLATSEGNDSVVLYSLADRNRPLGIHRVAGPGQTEAARKLEAIGATGSSLGPALANGAVLVLDGKGRPEPHFLIVSPGKLLAESPARAHSTRATAP